MKIACLLLPFFLATAVAAQEPSGDVFEPLVAAGTKARLEGNFEAAAAVYQNLLAVATEREVPIWQFRANFYLGLTRQEEAVKDPGRANALRAEAKGFYEKALQIKPDSTATMANLAELAEASELDTAIQWRERALAVEAIDNARYADLAVALAENHAANGDLKKAAHYFRLAAERFPERRAYHDATIAMLLDPRNEAVMAEELADYLFGMLARYEVDRVISVVCTVLNYPNLQRQDAPKLLAVLAEALVQKNYNLQTFSGSATMSQLEPLAATPHAAAIDDLKRLYLGDFTAPFDTWSERRAAGSQHPGPAEAFRNLARSIGTRALRDRDYARAERYFLLVQQLSGKRADPVALRDLAEVYIAERKFAKLDDLVLRYSAPLAMEQETAKWHERPEYERYLRFVDEVYSSVTRAKPQPTSQPRMAMLANTADGNPMASSSSSYYYGGSVPDREAIGSMVSRYERAGDHGKACSARLMAAEAYIASGSPTTAIRFLPPKPELCATGDRARFDVVLDRVVHLSPTTGLDAGLVTKIKQNLSILLQPDEASAHASAKIQLEAMGVRVDFTRRLLQVTTPTGIQQVQFMLPAEGLVTNPR